jgi:type IV pilus biogenesis protein PilP
MLRHKFHKTCCLTLFASLIASQGSAQTVGSVAVPPADSVGSPGRVGISQGRQEDDQNYLLRKQHEIFRLNVETDYANALQRLCQTGYGDPQLCQSRVQRPVTVEPPAPPEKIVPSPVISKTLTKPVTVQHRLPEVSEINGVGDDLEATIVMEDGRQIQAKTPRSSRPATKLPTGEEVIAIQPRQVVLRKPDSGSTEILPLGSRRANTSSPLLEPES